ncbi:hypothetical protein MGG_09503 [Pyricularia oryzae 70-15]|uniref:Aminoglycoside phosphotransferase domain-containing protein n=3 Tax=Pyricularia oryzae TaxID=318829 RepID=G4N1R9_PYRO7|nr:uncharacterized protein MGG_09503 [Pyricularia oryzae 70-15]EHA52434.1 hypothetical protein MGG_09503 [Pyricularia oryzae 70-15]ELQ38189.1 hypothetical protein OOU_Y34scaffold00548g5 [Pyricularia oryzae Y34]KAI7914176.1 hypothetical protein M0657_009629 [Pyricularia oryzae]KAI7922522.1 hypothetical protein M9X92_004815 [Pyricularia oryzae]
MASVARLTKDPTISCRLILLSIAVPILFILVSTFGNRVNTANNLDMARTTDPRRVAEIMLSWLNLQLVSIVELQTLWAGYGHICAVTARASNQQSAAHMRRAMGIGDGHGPQRDSDEFRLVLKFISPPMTSGDEGHWRKMLSYEVEQYFYDEVAPAVRGDAPVATCVASTRDMKGKPDAERLEGLIATLMSDLRPAYPVAGEKRTALNKTQVHAALGWLARFHRKTHELVDRDLNGFVLPPLQETERRKRNPEAAAGSKVWLNGGYTYLATRRKEYSSLARDEDSEWCDAFCAPQESASGMSVAEQVAEVLTPSGRPYETFVHGDVKSENLFTTEDGKEVAFYDFQYVGVGLGSCDLAKFFTCSVPLGMLVENRAVPDELPMGDGEMQLLKEYHQTLGLGEQYPWDLFVRHWETAMVDWCRFQASWGFWGNTDWLEARVRYILGNKSWKTWLDSQLGKTRVG